jgi:hypothetical protein
MLLLEPSMGGRQFNHTCALYPRRIKVGENQKENDLEWPDAEPNGSPAAQVDGLLV